MSAFEIGTHGDNVTDGDIGDCIATGYNLDCKFVTQNTWITKKRLFASKCM